MLPLLSFILFMVFPFGNNAHQDPPSPGYYLTSKIDSIDFEQGYENLWGPQHQQLQDGTLTLRLDKYSGSGFKSQKSYSSGYFGAKIKLGSSLRSAGVDTSLYLSSSEDCSGPHDEIDIEFLGSTKGKPYSLQTNVYIKGASRERNTIGREMKFHLWFDPTQDFHNYGILCNPNEIIFFVDDVPIRIYPKKSESTYPSRPMYVYGSIWDASSWATNNGKHVVNYNYGPFIGMYKNFKIRGCEADSGTECNPMSGNPSGSIGLSRKQKTAMKWAQHYFMIYYYCRDKNRDFSNYPECNMD